MMTIGTTDSKSRAFLPRIRPPYRSIHRRNILPRKPHLQHRNRGDRERQGTGELLGDWGDVSFDYKIHARKNQMIYRYCALPLLWDNTASPTSSVGARTSNALDGEIML